jgi:hypothetical protein
MSDLDKSLLDLNLNELDSSEFMREMEIIDLFLGRISENKHLWTPIVLSFLGIKNENQVYFLEQAKKRPF